jgi:acyl-CoA thioester hydrolase
VSAEIKARIEWSDTDAAGHHHHASIVRLVEAAEADLYRMIGEPQLMKIVPRVEYHAEYLGRLYYQDAVDVTLRVASVGRTSLTYTFEVRRADDGTLASRGGYVVVHIDESTGASDPWPDHLRKALSAD